MNNGMEIPPGGKQPRNEVNHSPPSRAQFKNGGAIRPLLYMFIGILLNCLNTRTILPTSIIIVLLYYIKGSRDKAVGKEIGYGLGYQGVGVRVPVGERIFTSPCLPDRLWGPLDFLSNG
jgi:hypothetical protein